MDEKKLGINSPLHIIIFDEIDAICRQRGSLVRGGVERGGVLALLLTALLILLFLEW